MKPIEMMPAAPGSLDTASRQLLIQEFLDLRDIGDSGTRTALLRVIERIRMDLEKTGKKNKAHLPSADSIAGAVLEDLKEETSKDPAVIYARIQKRIEMKADQNEIAADKNAA